MFPFYKKPLVVISCPGNYKKTLLSITAHNICNAKFKLVSFFATEVGILSPDHSHFLFEKKNAMGHFLSRT